MGMQDRMTAEAEREPLRVAAHNMIGQLTSIAARLDQIVSRLEFQPADIKGAKVDERDHPPQALSESVNRCGGILGQIRGQLDDIERILG